MEPTSTDHTCVTLPPRPPAVMTTCRVTEPPEPTLHLTDVSDSHPVDSHPVCPSRPDLVWVTKPMLDPCTVIEADPVPARLPRREMLIPPVSTDHAWLTLPALPPAVITARRVPDAPCPTLHLTDVSDSHPVDSHPVCPIRPLLVCDTSPMLDPCTVIDAAPVPARFPRPLALNMPTSHDHPWVTLPSLDPAVSTTRPVPPPPCPI